MNKTDKFLDDFFEEKENLIRSAITDNITVDYILAKFGDILGVYPDGSVGIGKSVGDEIAEDERPIATIPCPGWSNVDQSVYTDPWKYDIETDMYIDDEGFQHDIEECILLAVENDSSFRNEIIQRLVEY